MGDPLPTELRAGRYAIVGVLAQGSQAETLHAVDKQLGREVAIKRFVVRGAKSWKDVELAEREARVLASLSHPLLPSYIDYFEEEGALYLVMEKIEGESLQALRKRGNALGQRDVWRFLQDAAGVLDYLHTRAPPVIHRDIKPGNVLRRPDGSFVLVDFGSVRDKLQPSGGSTVVGTFGYMAPEQFQGRASAASDVYAVGATALVMLTGVEPEDLPHRGLSIDVDAALRGRAEPRLSRVLQAMLESDPDRRAPRIAPLLSQNRETFADEPASFGAPPRASRARTHRRGRTRIPRFHKPHTFPFAVMILFTIGLVLARTAVSLTLRGVIPILLTLLALLFGPALRQAARAVADAGRRASSALDGALRRVGRQPTIIDTEGEEVDAERDAHVRQQPRAPVRVEDPAAEDDVEESPARRRRRY
ncbi:MAG TPA: serine/threonine-protein kinase [Polyangiaceae bacterium]|nr:serine/threonine-protein kinase [Polyangiaceae bacterium]